MIPFHSISKPQVITEKTTEPSATAKVITVSIKSDTTKQKESQKLSK